MHVILTQDYYLYFAMKTFYPELQRMQDIEHMNYREQCVILIDSRELLPNVETAYKIISNKSLHVKSILLKMNSRLSYLLQKEGENIIDMSNDKNNALSSMQTLLTVKKYTPNVFCLYLNKTQVFVIESFLEGKKTNSIANDFNVPEKLFYRHRNKFSHFLGCGNFNQACLYIFRNSLTVKGYNIPKDWFGY